MAIGNPVSILAPVFTSSVGPFTTSGTTANAPVGSLVVLCFGAFGATPSITTVTDSASNTYQAAVVSAFDSASPGLVVAMWYGFVTTALPIGGTFTINGGWATASGMYIEDIMSISGLTGVLDATNSTVSATGVTNVSLPVGPFVTNNEIVIALLASTLHGISSYNEGSGFTTQALTNAAVDSWQIVSSGSPVTWNPNWTGSVNIAAVIASFSGTPTLYPFQGYVETEF